MVNAHNLIVTNRFSTAFKDWQFSKSLNFLFAIASCVNTEAILIFLTHVMISRVGAHPDDLVTQTANSPFSLIK
jgi:hypothetical protein